MINQPKTSSAKIDEIPKIIYLNSINDFEKKEYMETQFKNWGIGDYKRHEKKYKEENYDEWKELILDKDLIQTKSELALTLNTLQSVIDWYDSNESEICIFMDDIVNLNLINNWIFDWKSLMKNLPYNWDCIQLFRTDEKAIKMHLHPWIGDGGSCYCYMITRYFAKRLKHYHYKNGKFLLHYPTPNKSLLDFQYGGLDNFFYDIGITYTLPVFSLNEEYIDTTITDKLSSQAIDYWWTERSKTHSSFEFFHYNKNDEWKMEVMFDASSKNKYKQPHVFRERSEGLMIWI